MVDGENKETETLEKDETKETDISTTLHFLAQTFQKLADTAQRGHRDETNPKGLRRQQYGNWEAFTVAATICRDTAQREQVGKPPSGVSMLVSLYKTALDVSKQNE